MRQRRPSRMRAGAALSVLLHLTVATALMAHWLGAIPRLAEPPERRASVELILDGTGRYGSLPVPAASAPQPPARPAQPAIPAPDTVAAELPAPTPPPPITPQDVKPPSPPPAPADRPPVRLGGANDTTMARYVGPERPSRRASAAQNNKPPEYPTAAALRREHGDVTLLMHVNARGAVERVEVVSSSGFPLLDEAARKAALTWHFTPALRDGTPVPDLVEKTIGFELQ